MKKKPFREEINERRVSKGISRTRKILVWVFIIAFWVFFYWHQSEKQTQNSESGLPVEIQPGQK